MNSSDVTDAIHEWASERRLDRPHLERWLALDELSARALLDAARGLRMRAGQFRDALEMLEEIALVDNEPVVTLLARPALKRILERHGPAPARAHALVEELRALRFPRLRRALERLEGEIAALKLPRTITVVPPKNLGSDELRIEIRVCDGAQLGDSISALERSRHALERIAEMLGGEDF